MVSISTSIHGDCRRALSQSIASGNQRSGRLENRMATLQRTWITRSRQTFNKGIDGNCCFSIANIL